jgi:DNA-binding protein H-NS
MKESDFKSMTLGELWSLHEQIASVLVGKMVAEKTLLDQRLLQLASRAGGNATPAENTEKAANARRKYPRVLPKYRNPAQPAETWAGRGKQPRWLTAQLKSGKKLDDFRIQRSSNRRRRRSAK